MTARLLALALLAACTAPRSAAEPPVRAPDRAAPAMSPAISPHMLAHFAVVSRAQRAIAHSRLDEARWHARWLLEHDEPLLEDWQPFIDDMHAAARELASAVDLRTAGALAARLGLTCGRCHEARSAMVAFAWEPVPSNDPELSTQLARHTWAVARLWEGLIAPSDEMWRQGADVLATVALDALRSPPSEIPALASALRDAAGRARRIAGLDERSALYGELLSICAGCHGSTQR